MSTSFESFGKYVLLEKLATGGMAEVFLARGTGAGGIGKFFAIKRILPQYADSPEFIDMFKDEAKIAINLNHSNIVSIHEFGVEKNQFFLVMDYVEGRNLRQILSKMKKRNLQFSYDQIVYVIREVAAGLDHAHRCIDGSTGKPLNITHRDMSPQNLMVSFEGEVKIVDFGIAKAESQLETTRAGTLKGKFGYMSPEQAEGQPVDLRTDIFSLGIVMWELLANDRLFMANNEINTLRKIRDCQIPLLRKINPNIQPELERVAQKALARDRNLRYQTGAALHRDLNRFLNRQYPDFSPHDFSVFTKSVFTDEILSLRKRLVEYSKVNLSISLNFPDRSRNLEDQTSLINSTTDSLVLAESSDHISSEAISNISMKTGDKSTTTHIPLATRTNKDTSTTQTTSVMSPAQNPTATAASQASLAAMSITDGSGIDLPATVSPNLPAILDESALEAEMNREISVKVKMPTKMETEGTSSSISRLTRPGKKNRRRDIRAMADQLERSKPIRLTTYLVFAMLCFGLYVYMVKYFTSTMKDVISVTDSFPLMHDFHKWIGVEFMVADYQSVDRPPLRPIAKPEPRPQDDALLTPTALVVISNPSGAEIYLNGKNTGFTTPGRIEVPNDPFTISIHKHGYQDFTERDTTREKAGHRFAANLVKLNVAYLDIDLFPPQDATIFINGKAIHRRAPIHEFQVPANTELKIRAVNTVTNSYDEVTVNLPVDRRQGVQLNARRILRLPTNTPNARNAPNESNE